MGRGGGVVRAWRERGGGGGGKDGRGWTEGDGYRAPRTNMDLTTLGRERVVDAGCAVGAVGAVDCW